MKSATIEFPRNARTVYTAVKCAVRGCGRFSGVRCDDATFVVTGSHGWSVVPTGENVSVRVVATGEEACRVVVESRAKMPLNVFASNKENVEALSDFIANEVWRVLQVEDGQEHGRIRIVKPEIRMRRG